jgi:hypothetical protein
MELALVSLPKPFDGAVYRRRNVERGCPVFGVTGSDTPGSTTAALAPLTNTARTRAARAAVFTRESLGPARASPSGAR